MRLLFYPQSFGLNNIIVEDLMYKTNTEYCVLSDDAFIDKNIVLWFSYRWSNMSSNFIGRRYLRLFESLYIYLKLFVLFVVFNRYEKVVFNIVNWLPHEIVLLSFLKFLGKDVELVVHDWNEAQWNSDWYTRLLMPRTKIEKIFSNIVLYNLTTETFSNSKECKINFPRINRNFTKSFNIKDRKEYDFCFLGSYRKDKKIEELLNFPWLKNKCRLIGGHGYPKSLLAKFKAQGWMVSDGYISDRELLYFLLKSRFIVLPYLGGSASAWPQISDALRCTPIMSNSEAFRLYRKYVPSELYLENIEEEYIMHIDPISYLLAYE